MKILIDIANNIYYVLPDTDMGAIVYDSNRYSVMEFETEEAIIEYATAHNLSTSIIVIEEAENEII